MTTVSGKFVPSRCQLVSPGGRVEDAQIGAGEQRTVALRLDAVHRESRTGSRARRYLYVSTLSFVPVAFAAGDASVRPYASTCSAYYVF